ncbi:MAG: arginase family protein [Bacteroidota bacterium]
MLENWLRPVESDKIIPRSDLSAHHWGKTINIHEGIMPELKNTRLALIGIDADAANTVRKQLYQLTTPSSTLKTADLGNLIKVHPESLIPVLQECLEGGIIPVIIGSHQAFSYAQYKAYSYRDQLVNLAIFNERIAYTCEKKKKQKDFFFLNKIIEDKQSFMFHLSLLGYQSHFCDPKAINTLNNLNHELARLGAIKSNAEEVEPIIRDADLLSFDLSVLKHADAPGVMLPSPSGIFSEEACQVAHFAGLSDKLTSFGLYGFHPALDHADQTAKVMAQMIWYFAEGVANRPKDIPARSSKFVKYVVDLKQSDYSLVFWKSKKSERWWLQIPDVNRKKQVRHRLIPCSFNDYKLACTEEIPDRLLNAYKRFD